MAQKLTLEKSLPWVLLVGAIIGFIASFVLTMDTVQTLQDPTFKPSCSINPVLSCGSVMKSEQAKLFGFMNPLIGIAAFPALMLLSLALLAKAKFARWFWLLVQTVATLGVVFVHWLIFQSLYRLGTLCPYCMVVWTIVIPIFWYTTVYNLRTGTIRLPGRFNKVATFIDKHHTDIILVWLLVIIGLILKRFWYYFGA